MDSPGPDLDDEQHVKPAEKDGAGMEEVDRGDRLGLSGQELLPARSLLNWARSGVGMAGDNAPA